MNYSSNPLFKIHELNKRNCNLVCYSSSYLTILDNSLIYENINHIGHNNKVEIYFKIHNTIHIKI